MNDKINSTPRSDEIHSPPLKCLGYILQVNKCHIWSTLKPQSSDQDLAGVLQHWSSFHRPRQTGLASYLETANETGELFQVLTYISFKLIFNKFIFWIFMTYTALKFAIGKLISKANNAFHYIEQYTWFTKILLGIFFAT